MSVRLDPDGDERFRTGGQHERMIAALRNAENRGSITKITHLITIISHQNTYYLSNAVHQRWCRVSLSG